MSKSNTVASWVNNLHEVGEPIRRAARELSEQLDKADELEQRAREIRESVRHGESALVVRCAGIWSVDEVRAAMQGE